MLRLCEGRAFRLKTHALRLGEGPFASVKNVRLEQKHCFFGPFWSPFSISIYVCIEDILSVPVFGEETPS